MKIGDLVQYKNSIDDGYQEPIGIIVENNNAACIGIFVLWNTYIHGRNAWYVKRDWIKVISNY
jgi:hypothetical protein